MNILLLGKGGQLGQALQRVLPQLGRLVALDRRGAGGLCGNLCDLPGLAATVQTLQPDLVVNAAACTAVDAVEAKPAAAWRVNAEAPAVLARAAARCNALLLHYSSDHVFDGSGRQPWREADATSPLNVYGRSKRAGEQAIETAGCRHLILRTSWLYAASGSNFLTFVLRQAAAGAPLHVVDDQWGAPTHADLLAAASVAALRQTVADRSKEGLYHVAAGGATSRFDWAEYALACARRPAPGGLQAVPSPWPSALAPRPANSRLCTRRLAAAFGLDLPPWQAGVARAVAQWTARHPLPVPAP